MDDKDPFLLIERLRKGDEEAFILLIDLYDQRLFGYALTLTNDVALAQDILQNVFLRTWERRKNLVIKTSIQTYLFRSIHNEFVNQYNKKRSTMILERKFLDSLQKAIEFQEDTSWDRIITLVMSEIENLPPRCREIFLLSRKEGLTNLEISNYLNISIKTVEAQVTKAFKIIKNRIGQNYNTILFILFGFKLKNLKRWRVKASEDVDAMNVMYSG